MAVTMTPTTLAAPVAIDDRSVLLTNASAAGAVANGVITVDGEAMSIGSRYSSGNRVPVTRGYFGTVARTHATGAVVAAGPANYFGITDPAPGPASAANEVALPRIVIASAGGSVPPSISIYDALGATSATQAWVRYSLNGYPSFALSYSTSPTGAPPVYTGAGALTLMPGLSYIGSGGALAMTLAAPTLFQVGMSMIIQASTAQAHTVTYTPGFYGTTTSSDVATFGGAIGDNFMITVVNESSVAVWRIVSLKGVTVA